MITLTNALEWAATQDQFLFCVDLLDAYEIKSSDHNVNVLERKFERLIAARIAA